MRPATLVRLALAGSRTDTVRVALTAASAALATIAILSALTVLSIRPPVRAGSTCEGTEGAVCYSDTWSTQYTNNLLIEPGLRPGVAFALLLLCIPVLALAGQCARLGAPSRDRRLAAIRLAGAAPRQAVAIAAVETGLASALGSVLGLAAYLAGRSVLHQPTVDGRLPLPTDVRPATWLLALVVAGLPLLATAAAALLLRRVAFTPFGVARQTRTARPRPWPGVLIGLGVAAIAAITPLARSYHNSGQEIPQWMMPSLLVGGGLSATLGVIFGTAWISHATGRVLHRLARRPAPLLAARRLLADPWTGSRTFAALLACVVFGAGAAGFRAWFRTRAEVAAESQRAYDAARGRTGRVREGDDFYLRSLDLVDTAVLVGTAIAAAGLLVFLVEAIVSRRRALAALVATGVPRGVLARATGWQVVAPMAPAILLAVAVGAALPRGLVREERRDGYTQEVCTADWELCEEAGSPYLRTVEFPEIVRAVPIPYGDLAVVGGVALAAVLVMTATGLLFLRPSTDVTELRAG